MREKAELVYSDKGTVMGTRTAFHQRAPRFLEKSGGRCGGASARKLIVLLRFAATVVLVLTSNSDASAPTITKVENAGDSRHVYVTIDSRLNEAPLLALAKRVKEKLPVVDGSSIIHFRLSGQGEPSTWASVTLADGRKPLVFTLGFSAEELTRLVDSTNEQWLLTSDTSETLYTITVDEQKVSLVRHEIHMIGERISRESEVLRYQKGWLYEDEDEIPYRYGSSQHRYRFTEDTKKMHVERWSDSTYRGKWYPVGVAVRIPTTRQTGESSEPSAIVCNHFVLDTQAEDSTLHLKVETDLPDDTVVVVTVSRSYLEQDDPTATRYSIEYFKDKSTVGEWRTSRVISLADERWHSELKRFQEKMEPLGLGFTVGSISKHIDVSVVVPVNQPDSRFGNQNSKLTGKAVTKSGQLRIVRVETTIDRPLNGSP